MKALWHQCDPPSGYSHHGQPYRAWKRDGFILVECPTYGFTHVNCGEWRLKRTDSYKEIAQLSWYGRSRKKPPTAWANKIINALKEPCPPQP